jgi:formylglycine-generating enzyme required for sulfatase activity
MLRTVVLPLVVGLATLSARAADPKPPAPGRVPFDAARAAALQGEWAEFLGVPKAVTNAAGLTLALVPPGASEMGPAGSKYRVTLAKPYYIGTTEVTLGQYRRFKPGHEVPGAAAEFNAADRPAAFVSWDDARAFCTWLSDQTDEKAAGRVYALPTEARWEWAARAGAATAGHFGETDKGQGEYAWFNVTYTPNPKTEATGRGRQPVGKLKPNAWGLYDTLGNAGEWCGDRRADARTGETRDPVMRGGSWRSGAAHCTAIAHDPGGPTLKADHAGFRIVCEVPAKK